MLPFTPKQVVSKPTLSIRPMKKIGFLSFGHWTPSASSQTALGGRRAAAIHRSRRRRRGARRRRRLFPGASFRAPARRTVSAARRGRRAQTKKIEIGTAVIDMRYENPLYMAEDAGAPTSSPAGGCSSASASGSPEQVIDG